MLGDQARSSYCFLLLPNLPGRVLPLPQVLQQPLVAERIHALPEAFMSKSDELSGGSQLLQGIGLQTAVITLEVIKDLWLEYEEASVNPTFADLWLFGEFNYDVSVKNQTSKSSRGPDGCYCANPTMTAMKFKQVTQIDI